MHVHLKLTFFAFMLIFFTSCNNSGNNENIKDGEKVNRTYWGKTSEGDSVFIYTLTNSKGSEVTISNYGGTLTSFRVADKNGEVSSIVIGPSEFSEYQKSPPYFGAIIGRYANRIANAEFELNGQKYELEKNNGPNTLHGGLNGFDKRIWQVAILDDDTPSLKLQYQSQDGEGGYPGKVDVTVVYALSDADELRIDYTAISNKPTPINLTNHAYFNLTGDPSNTILDHVLQIHADKYTPVNSTLIPTGQLADVGGTPFDFTQPQRIGSRIDEVEGGYDHNWVLNDYDHELRQVATLSDLTSGRKLLVFTTEPGLQFYAGNFLDGAFHAQNGKPIQYRSALCLETQHFPDSPNQPHFPSTILIPGNKYQSTTIYKADIIK